MSAKKILLSGTWVLLLLVAACSMLTLPSSPPSPPPTKTSQAVPTSRRSTLDVPSTPEATPSRPGEWADYLYTIAWNDQNQPDGTISLYYDQDRSGNDGILIVADIPLADPTNTYVWNTSGLPEGEYYIYSASQDGDEITYQYTEDALHIQHDQACLDLSERPNLLPNPGFEAGLGNQAPSGWNLTRQFFPRPRASGYEWVNDPAQTKTGNRSIKLSNVFNGVNSESAWEDRTILRSPKLELPTPGGKYLFTAWIKTQSVDPGRVIFKFNYFDKDGDELPIRSHDDDTFFAGGPQTQTWSQVVFLLNSPHWASPPYPDAALAEKIQVQFSFDHSPGALWVDDLALVEISEAEYQEYHPNNRFIPPQIVQSRAPFFDSTPNSGISVQQDPQSGAWWLVRADGNAFWSIGAHIDSNAKLLATTGLSGAEYEIQAQIRARADLNFNQGWREAASSGEYTGIQNHIEWLNFSSENKIDQPPEKWALKDRNGSLMGGVNHRFPDVFSPIWQEHAIREAQTLLVDGGAVIASPQTMGYWTDNEIAYGDLYDFLWGEAARLAFTDWLQGKNDLPALDAIYLDAGSQVNLDVPPGYEIASPYRTIDELNLAWSSEHHTYRYRQFEDVYGRDKPLIRAHSDPIQDDLYAFERLIYKIYVDTIIDNIRRTESEFISQTGQGYHHLIFSNRFQLNSPAALAALQRNMHIFSRFDIIAVNWYPADTQSTTYPARQWIEIVKSTFHDTTGRPIYVSEFGLAAEDADDFSQPPGLFVARWREKTVEFQYQRGWAYHNFIATWVNLPFIVGANWYKWPNGYGDPQGSDPRNSGIVDDNDHYYSALTDNMRSINGLIQKVGRSSSFLDEVDWANIEINICNPNISHD